jgi:hypothetical protein
MVDNVSKNSTNMSTPKKKGLTHDDITRVTRNGPSGWLDWLLAKIAYALFYDWTY